MHGMRAKRGNRRRLPEALRRAADLAARRHGVVTSEQLRGLGISRGQVARELASGRMQRLYCGVYLLGPIVSQRARELAAVQACLPHAALSHRSAAYHWQLLPYPADPGPVDVTVTGRNPGEQVGIMLHRVAALDRREVRIRDEIPVTCPARTILDLAGCSSARALEQAVAEAFALRLTSRLALVAMIERHPRRPGLRALRALLDVERPPARTRSPAEERLLTGIRAARLPEPEVNARLGNWEVDFLWREQRLVVEVDGYASHSSPRAFERDRRKTVEPQVAGFTVCRISAASVRDEPGRAVETIARALSSGAAAPMPRVPRAG
jgi:very-short-patch-repair endonuclease